MKQIKIYHLKMFYRINWKFKIMFILNVQFQNSKIIGFNKFASILIIKNYLNKMMEWFKRKTKFNLLKQI